jgi:glycosyltransferase involved in cell wall biosynthesis
VKIFVLLCHASSKLHGEIREGIIAKSLCRLGHDARIFRMFGGHVAKSEMFDGIVPVTYYPSENPKDDIHLQISTLLCESICSERPDVVLLKGMDYHLSEFLIRRLDLSHTKIGFIVGGINVHPVLQHADFVLTESQRQSREVREFLSRPVPVEPLSKYVNWELADQLYANSTDPKRFGIVNVGFFDEGKNQIQLKLFFGKYRIAMIGHGPMLASVQQAAKGCEDVTFFGDMANDEALRIISQSRLMVHTSLWEGVPRAIIESLTCGTPVVAFDFAIQGDFGQTRAVRLVSREDLEPTVRKLLDDVPGLDELSREARRFALETHGAQKLEEAAQQILRFANQARRTDPMQRIAV